MKKVYRTRKREFPKVYRSRNNRKRSIDQVLKEKESSLKGKEYLKVGMNAKFFYRKIIKGIFEKLNQNLNDYKKIVLNSLQQIISMPSISFRKPPRKAKLSNSRINLPLQKTN